MNQNIRRICAGLAALFFLAAARSEGAIDLSKWKTTGSVNFDANRHHGETGAALRLEPGASAVWSLRDANGSGHVSFWVFDDGTALANPKERHAGPRWGVVQPDGRALAAGVLYAPYLAGDSAYAISDAANPLTDVQYLGGKRAARWVKWEFNFDADKGLTLLVDGTPVTRFDWNKTETPGFSGVAFFGDTPKAGKLQTLWVDDVEVTLGGPMKAQPTPPPPPAPILPEKDPKLDGPAAKLRPEILSQHPRLLFSAGDLPKLRENYNSAQLKPERDLFLSYLPSCLPPPTDLKFLHDATDGQRQGLWRLPTVAYHYLMTGDTNSLHAAIGFLKLFEKLEHWETGDELDSGMSSANIMIGAALAYDWLYDQLAPAFREAMRRKLILMARAQYYGGHLMKAPGKNKYWQNEPANNHRWHRDAGMALAVLAADNGQPADDWSLTKTYDEMKYVADSLPADGTSHEGPTYMVFGSTHLLLPIVASDRCFGTAYLQMPFFKTAGPAWIQNLTPGLKQFFYFGDSSGTPGGYVHFVSKLAAIHQQGDVQAALDEAIHDDSNPVVAWCALLWKNPELKGDYHRLPTTTFHPDIGVAQVRDGWDAQNVGLMFKCGPLGGYNLNRFRAVNKIPYINVAHDDPDANSFLLYGHGELLAETDRYSDQKRSANHNTILVNGVGQTAKGRPEGQVFSQPASDDMSQTAVITAWKDAGNIVVIEGEAAGSYPAMTKPAARPALDRFRRAVVWVKDDYVLVLDDIKAPSEVEITWLMQGAKLTGDASNYRLAKGAATCDFQVVSEPPFTGTIKNSPADDRGKPLGWQQLHATVKSAAPHFASVYDAWQRGKLQITQALTGATTTVVVTGPGIHDTWTWQPAAGQFEARTLTGKRDGGFTFIANAGNAKPPTP